jgi:hypothetical protein
LLRLLLLLLVVWLMLWSGGGVWGDGELKGTALGWLQDESYLCCSNCGRFLSLSPPMQNAKDPCHDVAWQKKSSSPEKKKLKNIERVFS